MVETGGTPRDEPFAGDTVTSLDGRERAVAMFMLGCGPAETCGQPGVPNRVAASEPTLQGSTLALRLLGENYARSLSSRYEIPTKGQIEDPMDDSNSLSLEVETPLLACGRELTVRGIQFLHEWSSPEVATSPRSASRRLGTWLRRQLSLLVDAPAARAPLVCAMTLTDWQYTSDLLQQGQAPSEYSAEGVTLFEGAVTNALIDLLEECSVLDFAWPLRTLIHDLVWLRRGIACRYTLLLDRFDQAAAHHRLSNFGDFPLWKDGLDALRQDLRTRGAEARELATASESVPLGAAWCGPIARCSIRKGAGAHPVHARLMEHMEQARLTLEREFPLLSVLRPPFASIKIPVGEQVTFDFATENADPVRPPARQHERILFEVEDREMLLSIDLTTRNVVLYALGQAWQPRDLSIVPSADGSTLHTGFFGKSEDGFLPERIEVGLSHEGKEPLVAVMVKKDGHLQPVSVIPHQVGP